MSVTPTAANAVCARTLAGWPLGRDKAGGSFASETICVVIVCRQHYGRARSVTFSERSFFVGPDDDPDKYRLRAQVSAGGEAELWQADVAVAGTWEPVAVKILRTELFADLETWKARWAQQAELLRFIRHPAVVGIREDFEGAAMHLPGEADSSPGRALYLVMNWVDGQDLRSWVPLHRTPEGILEGLLYLQQVATVLDWLHSGEATPSKREVIHADVSPANVIVTPAGQAVLVDFGLLRVAAQITGAPEGTYMPPEVRTQGHYSPGSDRFSFGGLAYFVLTGNHPPHDPAALRAGLGQVGMIGANTELLGQLMEIFSDDPTRRPPAGEWVRTLRQASSTVVGGRSEGVPALPPMAPGQEVGAPPVPPPTDRPAKRTALIAGLVAAAVIIAGGGIYALSSLGGSKHPVSGAAAAAVSATTADPTTTQAPTTTTTVTPTTVTPTPAVPPTTVPVGSPVATGGVKLLDPTNNTNYVVLDTAERHGVLNIGINGTTFADAAEGYGVPAVNTAEEVDFNLSRSFTTFSGRVGVADTSPASCQVEIQILADGNPLLDQTFGLGASKDFSFSVTGILRIQVIFAKTTDEYANGTDVPCFAALGEPIAS